MPASLPPRKAPPARRITQSSTNEHSPSFPSTSQPPSSSQHSLTNTPTAPSQHPPQSISTPRHAQPSDIPRFRNPPQMTNVSQPQSSDIKSHMSAPQQHVHPQSQHQQSSQQPIMHPSFVSQGLPPTSHPAAIPHQQHRTSTDHLPSNTPINSAQLVAVTMGLNTNNMPHPQSAAVQYPNPAYANPAYFDQFNMASSIPLSMSPANPAVAVVRDIDRQSHTNTPHVNPRTPPQPIPKAVIQSSDVQYPDQTHQTHQLQNQQNIQQPQQTPQQQILHRPPAIQVHPQQDMQGHPIPPQHMQQQLYQPLDPQQTPQHLVMNQGNQFVQQTQGVMHNQTAQLQQPSHMPSQDAHFDHHAYQIAHQSQLANVNNMALQQTGDLQGRKTVNAATQTELLGWNGAAQGRVMAPQGAAEMSNAIAPGTLINPSGFAPSHIFEMGMADMRQQSPQNPLALQQVQGQKVQQTPTTAVASNTRKSANQATDISPRKRRQTNSGAAQNVTPPAVVAGGRTFACSGCGQDFAQKRDRDNHVRTVHERSFSCSKCTSRFKTKSDANRHVRIVHDRVRPYSCPSCPSMFSERNKLRRHRETVHQKLRPFGCPVCPARFGELGNLRQHTSSLHPETTIDNAQIRSRAAQAAAAATAGVNSQIQS